MMIERKKLAETVGESNLYDDEATLEAYSRDMSFANPTRPRFVVKPHTATEVKELVKLARETNTPLVPVSSGAPHFRGDTVPSTGGAVVVDLSEMKKIVFVDRARRVAMVEPGVTFGELIPVAREEGIRLNMPLLPRSTKSVVGSMLEREPVVMPSYQWDVSDPLACLEVVFGTGDDFRTGQAAGPGTVEEQWAVGGRQKAPYGPHVAAWHRLVQGAQGTMGIVTWASLRCELLPQVQEAFLVGSARLGPLLEMARWLIRLRLVNECFVLSGLDLAAVSAQARPGHLQRLRSALPAWTLFYVVAGYEYFPEERVAVNIKDISALGQRLGLEPVPALGGISARELMKTVQQPSGEPYWKLRYKGGCEDVLFLAPFDRLEVLTELVARLALEDGLTVGEYGVYIQPTVQGTSCHCEFNFFYDPDDAQDVLRVKRLVAAAVRSLLDAGAFFSRPYGEAAGIVMNRDAASLDILRRLKKIFDPAAVMNPGKLCF